MQTIERPGAPPRAPRGKGDIAGIVAGIVLLPVLLFAIFTQWGVLIALIVAVLAGIGIWVWKRDFLFIEVVAFLIHFDGLAVGPISMGRIVAAIIAVMLVAKLVGGWRPPAVPVWHWAPVWALTTWAVVSGLWSAEVGGFLFNSGVFGLGVAYFCVTALLLENHRMIQQFLRAYWVGGLVGAAAGILALFLGTRSVGMGADANLFGLLAASMIPLTIYYRRHAPTDLHRWAYTVALLVVLFGAAGAGSRSGMIGAGVAFVGSLVTRPGISMARRVAVSVQAVLLTAIGAAGALLLNPHTAVRGLHDRGAGRLDLWHVATELAKDNPFWGYGFGQVRSLIPPHLLVTPGSERLNELRPDVNAHHTWLEIWGDLGVIGLLLFVTIYVVAIVGFLRPRWTHTRELSTMLMVMMLPVLTGSFFLPLLNNKLAWALIGISAALHVPSVRARWGGRWGGRHDATALPAQAGSAPLPVVAPVGSAVPAIAPRDVSPEGPRGVSAVDEAWEPIELARWDLRISRRHRVVVVAVAVFAGLLAGGVTSNLPSTWTATAGLIVPRLDEGQVRTPVLVQRTPLQGVLTMGMSGAVAQELRERSGVDLSVEEVRDNLFVTRPRMGLYLELHYSDVERDRVDAVAPHLLPALAAVYDGVREFALDEATNQLRPVLPGETRIDPGPRYLPAYDEVGVSEDGHSAVWSTLVGGAAAAMAALGVVLVGQRRPRVTARDDLRRLVGVPVWAHLGGGDRRSPITVRQYDGVLTAARDGAPIEVDPVRFLVTSPVGDRAVDALAIGLAARLAHEGRRVLLIDGRGRRLGPVSRLGRRDRPGLRDVGDGRVDLEAAMSAVPRSRLPRQLRLGADEEDRLRFLSAGQGTSPSEPLPLDVLDQLDDDVAVVLLGPSILDASGAVAALAWADATALAVSDGRTTTAHVVDAADAVRTYAPGPHGIVVLGR